MDPERGLHSLSDELARMCLGSESRSCQALAWANSICVLFILWGLLGFMEIPTERQRRSKPAAPIPALLVATHEPREQKRQTEIAQRSSAPSTGAATTDPATTVEIPAPVSMIQVPEAVEPKTLLQVTLIEEFSADSTSAATDSADSPPAQFVPPAAIQEGYFPAPDYPEVARRNRIEGTVHMRIIVQVDGRIAEARIEKSSGHSSLDQEALETVRTRWRFGVGEKRTFLWPCVFKLKQKR